MTDIFEFEPDPDELHLVGTPATLIPALMAKSQKSKAKGAKKMAMLTELQAAVADLEKAITGLARNGGAVDSLPTVAAAHANTFGRLPSPFKPFEDRVAQAQADLAKAVRNDNGSGWEVTAARRELIEARHRLVLLKMMAAESARQSDPATMARRLNGQGVPLFSNRHALAEDVTVRYV